MVHQKNMKCLILTEVLTILNGQKVKNKTGYLVLIPLWPLGKYEQLLATTENKYACIGMYVCMYRHALKAVVSLAQHIRNISVC